MQCESCTALMSIVSIGMLARLGNKQANMSLSHPGALDVCGKAVVRKPLFVPSRNELSG